MKKIVVNKSILNSLSFLNAETIEKAKKGEQLGGEYLYREEIAEKVTTDKDGHKKTTRYKYYYVDDMLQESETKLLDRIINFFYKKFPENKEKIESSYEKQNIKNDYGVDKKTYYQHIMEYLSHRSFWDKKFADKALRKKHEKPVKEDSEDPEIEKPVNKVPKVEKNDVKDNKEKKWIPNNSLMRKIWSMNTGKEIEKKEKQQIEAQKKIQESEQEKHNNRSNAMLGNDNAKKDGIIIEEGENGNNKTDIESGRISTSDKNLWESGSTDSHENVPGTENSGDRNELLFSADEPGIGSTVGSDIDYGLINIGDGSGRLTPKQAKEIREACHKLLASKTDSEMNEQDKALLSMFVGAGGTGEEDATNTGVLTEFYTPRKVVNKCWELLDKWCPNKKTCIEPSSGIGRFAEGRNEKFTMFELEEDSARIAKILHPDAEVVQGNFEKHWIKQLDGRFSKNNFEKFDCSVGNPPYMDFTGWFKGHYDEGKDFTRAEQYFLSRTLDSLKDNGVLVFVMPSGFLQGNSAKQKKAKEIIAKKGKLLEAWRLPSGSFDTTDVGTDIIVVRKEPGSYDDFVNDNYFKNNPNHIMGDVVKEYRQHGQVEIVRPRNGETFETEIDKINVNDVEADVKELPKAETVIEEKAKPKFIVPADKKYGDEIDTPEGKGKITGFVKSDNQIIGYKIRVGEKPVTLFITEHEKRSNAMKGNKNAAGKHNFIPSDGINMTAEQFAHKYGMDMNQKELDIWKFTDYNGDIDTTKLTAEQMEYINSSKNYVKDGNKVINTVNYASGNIREKLDDLEVQFKGDEITKEDYEFKKSLLEAAMPVEKKIQEIKLSPIADWTRKYTNKDGVSLIHGFYEWIYAGNVDLSKDLPFDSPVAPEEIPPQISFFDIIDYIDKKSLRSNGFRDKDSSLDKGKLKFIRTEKRRETAEYLFNKYIQEGLTDEEREELTKRWNDNFNSFKNPDYTKMPIFIDGMNEHKGTKEFTLTPQQLKGISFLTNKGSGLLAYGVGVGKTVTGLAATVNQIQTGRAKRPLICVPNSVYEKWVEETRQHFPNIKINELHNFSKGNIPDGWKPEEGSISICTYEALAKTTFHDETMDEISSDVEFAMLSGRDEKLSKRKAALKGEKIKELAGRMTKSKGDEVYFEDLGFDHITVDEIHNFKNIFFTPRNVDIKQVDENGNEIRNNSNNEFSSLGGAKSERGEKLFAITQYIQRHNNNRNVFGLSATPFQNSPIEIYNILSLFARQRMKDLGIYSLEEFVKQFAQLKSEYAVTATGFKEKMVMKDFSNRDALQNLITEYIDKVDGDEAHVIRPKKRVHLPRMEMTDLQRQIMAAENAYMEEQASLPADERDLGSTFTSLNAMRMATLSPALVKEDRFEKYRELGFDIKKPDYKEIVESSPKLKFVCESIIENYKKASKEGQVMYMPKGVDYYDYVADYLVKRGIPREAIGFMKGGSGEKELERKDALTKEFNDENGKCKIIIGSEAIKEGVSLNGNSTVMYNCMLGWNPTEPEQVEGRIWRQGNKQGITHIVYPLLNDSIDPMLYQKYDEKTKRINNLFSYKDSSLQVSEINPEELKFDLIKDPEKRADLLTKQHKEKAESDRLLYGQMIDILAKQSKVAFGDPMSNPEYSAAATKLAQLQKPYNVFVENKKKFEANIKEMKDKGEDWENSYANRQLAGINKYISDSKKQMDEIKKVMKRVENNQKSIRNSLARRGINSMQDAENKRQEYARLMNQARKEAENADKMKEEFLRQAIADNIKNAVNVPSFDEVLKKQVADIRGDLHLMDDEWREKLEKELNKSIPLFFIYNGRFYINKRG